MYRLGFAWFVHVCPLRTFRAIVNHITCISFAIFAEK
jgi:hypothetical protein